MLPTEAGATSRLILAWDRAGQVDDIEDLGTPEAGDLHSPHARDAGDAAGGPRDDAMMPYAPQHEPPGQP